MSISMGKYLLPYLTYISLSSRLYMHSYENHLEIQSGST